jgi:hypothetical protein
MDKHEPSLMDVAHDTINWLALIELSYLVAKERKGQGFFRSNSWSHSMPYFSNEGRVEGPFDS